MQLYRLVDLQRLLLGDLRTNVVVLASCHVLIRKLRGEMEGKGGGKEGRREGGGGDEEIKRGERERKRERVKSVKREIEE